MPPTPTTGGLRARRSAATVVAVVTAAVLALAGPVVTVPTAAAEAPTRGPPTWRVYAFTSPDVAPSTFRVTLVRRASGDPVRGATVRFLATRRTGGQVRARVVTGSRGVARWSLPVPSRRLRYVEATYYAPGVTDTYLRLGFCRRPAGWRECGAG